MNFVTRFLNSIPMYRITLYYVGALWLIAVALGFLGMLPFTGISIAVSGVFLMGVCGLISDIFAKIFVLPENHESALITALILTLIVPPVTVLSDFWFLATVATIAMSSKYIIAIKGKHIFNPAAVAVAITALIIGRSATWWVGTAVMLPFVFAGGILLTKKIRRFDAVLAFVPGRTSFCGSPEESGKTLLV